MNQWNFIKNYKAMDKHNLFSNEVTPQLRRSNGRFATPEQAMMDKLSNRNRYLEYENEMLKRKLVVFNKLVTDRKIEL